MAPLGLSLLTVNELPQTIILMKRISFYLALLVLSFPERHSTYLSLTYTVVAGRMGHIWSDIILSNNRCLLSEPRLGGRLSLTKVLRGEIKALEVMLHSASFFIKINKEIHEDSLVYWVSSPTARILPHPLT